MSVLGREKWSAPRAGRVARPAPRLRRLALSLLGGIALCSCAAGLSAEVAALNGDRLDLTLLEYTPGAETWVFALRTGAAPPLGTLMELGREGAAPIATVLLVARRDDQLLGLTRHVSRREPKAEGLVYTVVGRAPPPRRNESPPQDSGKPLISDGPEYVLPPPDDEDPTDDEGDASSADHESVESDIGHSLETVFPGLEFGTATERPRRPKPDSLAELVFGEVEFGTLWGWWRVTEPIHERATFESLALAGFAPELETWKDERIWEFVRGVYWNDDPDGLLFEDCCGKTMEHSWGVVFGRRFKAARKQAKKALAKMSGGEPASLPGPESNLLARSHFGDLQFLHAMRSSSREDLTETENKMLDWAEFAYNVATHEVGAVRLSEVNAELRKLGRESTEPLAVLDRFEQERDMTVAELFRIPGKGNVQERALGSILHMIQDSYSGSHAQRNETGVIEALEFYGAQDSDCHAEFDRAKLESDAVQAGAELLSQWSAGASWEKVRKKLCEGPFKMRAKTGLAPVCPSR